MTSLPGDDIETERQRFLLDGLVRDPSPVLLIAYDRDLATALAFAAYPGEMDWPEEPAARGIRSLRSASSTRANRRGRPTGTT